MKTPGPVWFCHTTPSKTLNQCWFNDVPRRMSLNQCWFNDGQRLRRWPSLNQHWFNVLCLEDRCRHPRSPGSPRPRSTRQTYPDARSANTKACVRRQRQKQPGLLCVREGKIDDYQCCFDDICVEFYLSPAEWLVHDCGYNLRWSTAALC